MGNTLESLPCDVLVQSVLKTVGPRDLQALHATSRLLRQAAGSALVRAGAPPVRATWVSGAELCDYGLLPGGRDLRVVVDTSCGRAPASGFRLPSTSPLRIEALDLAADRCADLHHMCLAALSPQTLWTGKLRELRVALRPCAAGDADCAGPASTLPILPGMLSCLSGLECLRLRGGCLPLSLSQAIGGLSSSLRELAITQDSPHAVAVDSAALAQLTGLTRLELTGAASAPLEAMLQAMSLLQHLDLSHSGIRELRWCTALTQLRHLRLHGAPVRDLAPLAPLASLQVLCLRRTLVRDLGALSRAEQLVELDVCGTRVKDLAALAGLPRLRVLWTDVRTWPPLLAQHVQVWGSSNGGFHPGGGDP